MTTEILASKFPDVMGTYSFITRISQLHNILCPHFWARCLMLVGRLKMRDWNYRHHQKCRGGKCRTGNIGTKLQGWKMRDQAAMESQNIRYILIYNTQVALDAVRDSVVSSLGGVTRPAPERADYRLLWSIKSFPKSFEKSHVAIPHGREWTRPLRVLLSVQC